MNIGFLLPNSTSLSFYSSYVLNSGMLIVVLTLLFSCSRDLSEKVQKTKEDRVMQQKSRLEAQLE